MFKRIAKILLYLFFSIAIVFTILFSIIFINQDRIIKLTINELNKYLITKVEVSDNIDTELFSTFPNASVKLEKVRIYESIKGSDALLADLESAYLAIDLWTLITKGNISISRIFLENGSIDIKFLSDGSNNFSIIKFPDEPSDDTGADFNINLISLEKVNLKYSNEVSEQRYDIFCKNNQATLSYVNEIWDIKISGHSHVNYVSISNHDYVKDKSLDITCRLAYDESQEYLNISQSAIKLNSFLFSISGDVKTGNTSEVNINIEGEEGRVESLLSLLPPRFKKDLGKFRAKGDVYFKGKVAGVVSATKNPLVELSFGFSDTSLEHPNLNSPVTGATLKGSFTNGKFRNETSTLLALDELKGIYDGKTIKGRIVVANFQEPTLDMELSGAINLGFLLAIYPIEEINSAEGEVEMNIHFNGRLADFKTHAGSKRINTSGDIILRKVRFKHVDYPYEFKKLNGNFLFNRSDLAINEFTGYLGKSHFDLKGSFRNIIPRLVFQREKLFIEADLKSNHVDLEELLDYSDSNNKQSVSKTTYQNTLFDHYDFKLNCDIRKLNFKKFSAKNIKTTIKTNTPFVKVNRASLDIAGGNLSFNSDFNLSNLDNINVTIDAIAKDIHSDSLFYIFGNFDQQFITHKHLKGQIFCQGLISFKMNQHLDIHLPTIASDLDVTIKNGHLIAFEPMQQLSKFIDEKSLANINFSEMRNKIHIVNEVIYIPEMMIKSNIADISVSGSHSFNTDMDYRLGVPLKAIKKNHKDKDEAFGAIEDDGRRGAVLFLTIKGNSDNYKVGYDSKRAVKKIGEDIKGQGQEIKDIIKGRKDSETRYHELDTEEYFDFDED
ncbi:AsmA-like C-terminal region-containing protein [Cytophagaceae bacterium ABcell3]|nr:AsmA-like C-terminal region-containing protein [Cytophagaceae bacterium ABcell3]